MKNSKIKELTLKIREVMEKYKENFPEVKVDRDYLPFKITEEWGECLQAYLMLTDRGRQKEKNKEEIRKMLSEEFADVFSYLLLFAEDEGIDIEKSLEDKWFPYLEK